MLALNDFKELKKDDIDSLAARADMVLGKCKETENISSEFLKTSWFKGIILCPESIVSEIPKSFSSQKCVIISPVTTIRDNYHAYVKAGVSEELEQILKNIKFMELTGYRNTQYNDISQSNAYKNSFEVFEYVDIDKYMNDENHKDIIKNALESNDSRLPVETKETSAANETVVENETQLTEETETSMSEESTINEPEELGSEENQSEESMGESEEDTTSFLDVVLGVLICVFITILLILLVSFIFSF